MSEIDRELIRRKLETLRDYLQKLEDLKSLDRETFLIDHHNFGLAEHYLQLSIEIVLDVCRHLVVALNAKTPEDSRGLFKILAEYGVLTDAFSKKNQNMAAFRNRLVHEYSEVDHEKVYDYLQDYFGELEKFIVEISSYFEKK
jgi:uncharacterized protein YutE (UPF0331/DUF86 family)